MGKFLISGFADEISPDFSTQLRILNKLGICYIEPRGINGINVSELRLEQAKEAKKQMDAAGIQVSSIGSPIGKIGMEDDFSAHLDVLQHTLEVTRILEADKMRIFSFYIPEGKRPETYEDAVFERMERLIETAKPYGVTLLHENERGIYGERSEQCFKLAEEFYGDHFQLVFDPANYVLCGEPDCMDALKKLYPYTTYFHIKDGIYKEDRVVPAGMGEGKLPEILRYAKAQDYSGFLSLEPHLTHFDGLDAFDQFIHLKQGEMTGEQSFTIAHGALINILNELD